MVNGNVLVLNRLYQPIHVTTVRRAFALLYQGLARAIDREYRLFDFDSWSALSAELHRDSIGTVGGPIRIPRVIVLIAYDRLPKTRVRFSRFNIYARDQNTCQYCGRTLPRSDLNLDHVIPRSKGGTTTFGQEQRNVHRALYARVPHLHDATFCRQCLYLDRRRSGGEPLPD